MNTGFQSGQANWRPMIKAILFSSDVGREACFQELFIFKQKTSSSKVDDCFFFVFFCLKPMYVQQICRFWSSVASLNMFKALPYGEMGLKLACRCAVSGSEHFPLFLSQSEDPCPSIGLCVRTYVCVLRSVGVVVSWLGSALCSEEQTFFREGGNKNHWAICIPHPLSFARGAV